MKVKKYLQVLFILCILQTTSAFANTNEISININNISVQDVGINTRVILKSNSPLPLAKSHYSKDEPSTIIVELKKAKMNCELKSNLETSLIEKIKVDKSEPENIRFFINLKEKVPYRIYSKKNDMVVELNKINHASKASILDAEIRQNLTNRRKHDIYFRGIDISERNDRIDITAKLSDEVISNVFALNDPLRLVIDLFDTLYSRPNYIRSINKLGIKKIRAAQFKISNPYTITRIVFDLDEPKFYTLNSKKDELCISFYKNSASYPLPKNIQREPGKPIQEKTKAEPLREAALKNPSISAKKQNLDSSIEEKVSSSKTSLEKRIEPQKPIRSNSNTSIRPGIQENQFQPKTIARTEKKYTGELLSLKFKDADLRDIILYLGEFAHLNVVFDPEVRGVVTCNLVEVPWDQALDIILRNNKIGKTIEGNILRIAPIRTLTQEDEEQRKLAESKELAGPLVVKTFTLSYSRARDIQGLLKSKISERGEIVVDERTNTLIITEVKDKMEILEKLISVFDTATPQVSIEARIVEATSTFIRNLGIQWGWRGVADPFYGNQTSLKFPNKILADGSLIPQGIVTKGIGGSLGGYAVNLPAPAFTTAVGFSFANVLDTFSLDVALSALETSGQGRIISCPKISTQNNQEAEIIQGRQIPVQTVANFTVTTRYVNAALELRATPQITAEGTIIMFIEIKNNAADFANLVSGIPPITTQSAKTTVMIPDGGTTVIGGIYRTEDSITRERVPFLHKIPILGYLFRSFARTKQNRELLIFITPRIIK